MTNSATDNATTSTATSTGTNAHVAGISADAAHDGNAQYELAALLSSGPPTIEKAAALVAQFPQRTTQTSMLRSVGERYGGSFARQVAERSAELRQQAHAGHAAATGDTVAATLLAGEYAAPAAAQYNANADGAATVPRGPQGTHASLPVASLAVTAGVPALGGSAAQRHADEVARVGAIFEIATNGTADIIQSLIPAYCAARDRLDISAVADIGGRLIGGFGLVHGANAALTQLLAQVAPKSVQGQGDAHADVADAQVLQRAQAGRATLRQDLAMVDHLLATTLPPHRFHNREVAGKAVALTLTGASNQVQTQLLTGELQRTLGMLALLDEIKALTNGKLGDVTTLHKARDLLVPWASRPLDLAFLRAALGSLWTLLDASAVGPRDWKPTEVFAQATTQAKHTGWLGDVGTFDMSYATGMLSGGGRGGAEAVLRQLYTADPNARAMLLMQLQERKLFTTFCEGLGWQQLKDLHDSLGTGFGDIKHALQPYFLGEGKFGPSLGQEWEHHAGSSRSQLARLGGVGTVLNFGLDIGTFGFHSSYGKALDNRSEGWTSHDEARRAKRNAAGQTAAVAAVSLITGGMADKWVRGGTSAAGTVAAEAGGIVDVGISNTRAALAGAAGGSTGAVTGLGAADVYNNVAGDQTGFSSPAEYAKAMLLGGAIGGGLGALNNIAGRWRVNRGARVAAQVADETPLANHAESIKLGDPRSEQEMLLAVKNGKLPRYLARVGPADSKYNTFGNGRKTFVFATEPADLRGISAAEAMYKVGWSKEWIEGSIGKEIEITVVDTQVHVPTATGPKHVNVDHMTWKELKATTMADARFMAGADGKGLTRADVELLFERASGAPISEAAKRVGSAYEGKMEVLAKLLNDQYSCNSLYTGLGVTATEVGTLGAREVAAHPNETGFRLEAGNHKKVSLGILTQGDVDKLFKRKGETP